MMTIYLTGFRCSDTQYLPNILSRQIIIIKPWSLHWDYDTRVVKDGIWAIPSAMTRLNGLQSMEMQLIRCISSCIPSNFQGKTLGQEGLHNSFAKSEMTNCYHLIIWYGIRVKCVPSKKGSTLSLSLNATRICPRCTHQGLCTHPWIRKPMTRGHRFVCQMSCRRSLGFAQPSKTSSVPRKLISFCPRTIACKCAVAPTHSVIHN